MCVCVCASEEGWSMPKSRSFLGIVSKMKHTHESESIRSKPDEISRPGPVLTHRDFYWFQWFRRGYWENKVLLTLQQVRVVPSNSAPCPYAGRSALKIDQRSVILSR